jgi:integrase
MADRDDTLDKIRALLGESSPDQGPPFATLWRRYYREEARYLSSSRDSQRIGSHLMSTWAERPALSLSTEDVETYRDSRKSTVTRRGAPPAPATVNRELASARRCLQWAVENRLLKYNPLASLKMEAEDNIRKSKIGTEADLQRLLEHADRTMRALILAQIDCGFRRMEIFSLQWDQIILVPHRGGLRPMVQLWETKNGRRRRAALSQRSYEAIWALPRFGRYVFVGREPGRYRGDGREAPPRPGTHISPDATLRKFQRLAAKSGLTTVDGEPFTFHMLRHSFAYLRRVRDKASQFAIKLQGGWLTNSAFERYGIGGEEELAEMYEAVDAHIAKAEAELKPKRR